MKKRLLTTLLTIACAFSLVACSGELPEELQNTINDAISQSTTGTAPESTEAPAEPTEAPAEPTEAPAEPTEVPAEPTEAPAEPTEAPAEPTEVPAEPTEAPAEPTEEPGTTVAAPTELSDDIYSFQVSIDGTIYQFPMWYEDFVALDDWTCDEDITETLSTNQYMLSTWKRDDVKVYVTLANLSMNTVTLDKTIVAGIQFDSYYMEDADWEIILPKGIKYNEATQDDIIAAYGEPSDDYDGTNYYKMTYEYDYYQEIDLYISKETNKLYEIEIRNMIELEGADNSVNPEVPDFVKNYVAPEALSDSLYDFTFDLDGTIYELPCPVSVFLENGFTINESASEMEIASGQSGWLELKYKNMVYRTLVKNFAEYATIAENCFVQTIKTSEFDPKFNITIPGNIKRGDSEEDLLAVIESFNYETSESGDFTYYTIYHPDRSKLDAYDIVVTEGKVHSIEIQNGEKLNK